MTRNSVSGENRVGPLSEKRKQLLQRLRTEHPGQTHEIEPRPRALPTGPVLLPTSWAQQRLWSIDRSEAGSAGYQVFVAVRLQGTLDQDALRKALDSLVERHEVFRTILVEVDGEPKQQISANGAFALRIVDLSELREAERQRQVRLHQLEQVHSPFDLGVGPLARGRLLRLHAQEHVLLLSMHQVVSDGSSKGTLFRQLAQLYGAYQQVRPNPLGPLPIQYGDYAWWQRHSPRREKWTKQLSYWRARLHGITAQMELPTDRPRRAVQSSRGENVPLVLDAQLSGMLRELAQRHGMTLFMVLCAGWAILLFRLSGHENITIGTPIANRQHPELQEVIGFFVNMLVLRFELSQDLKVEEFLHQVRGEILGAYDHRDIPFEQVVKELQSPPSMVRNSLFQTVFVLQNTARDELILPGLTSTLEAQVDEPSIVDLWLCLEDRVVDIAGTVNYSADLFDRATIDRWMACFTALLKRMTDGVQCRLTELPISP